MIYNLKLSNKDSISISEEELEKFKQNIAANFIEFSEGIINPSFVISITIDREASRAQINENRKQNFLPDPPEEYLERGTPEMKQILAEYRAGMFPETKKLD